MKPIYPSWQFCVQNLTIETLEQGVKYDAIDVALGSLMLTLTIFHIIFYVSIFNLKEVNAGCALIYALMISSI